VEVLRTIGGICVAAVALSVGTALPALAQCRTDQYESVEGPVQKPCTGRLELSCGGQYPEVKPGKSLCCELDDRHLTTWYCNGISNSFKCTEPSVSVGVKVNVQGLALTCYAKKPKLPPPATGPDVAPDGPDAAPEASQPADQDQ